MKRTALLGLLLALALCAPALARSPQNVPLQRVINALEAPFAGGRADARKKTPAITDFQGKFLQQSRLVSLNRTQRGRGTVAVKFLRARAGRPATALFRWDYSRPTKQEIVSDGRTLWVYVPDNGQVIRSDIAAAFRRAGSDPLSFLTGLGELSRHFTIRWATPSRDAAGNYVLELTPRHPSALIQRLLLVVKKQAVPAPATKPLFPILSSTVYDLNGNTTTIEFRQIRVNRRLPTSFFHFQVPPGVEVVRPGKNRLGY